jgi:hypothetical protein
MSFEQESFGARFAGISFAGHVVVFSKSNEANCLALFRRVRRRFFVVCVTW